MHKVDLTSYQYRTIHTKEDLINLINYIKQTLFGTKTKPYKDLDYFVLEKYSEYRYQVFSIKKKNGGERMIYAPTKSTKTILKIMKLIFESKYNASECVYGFNKGCSIVDNAECHIGQKFIWNIDLKDFFTYISKEKVSIRLQKYPYHFSPNIADILSSICCINVDDTFFLPQGYPTSPILSNLVCDALDRKLLGIADRYCCNYSRYADDITFSSNVNLFTENHDFINDVYQVIEKAGFVVNKSKERLQCNHQRQICTGLVVSEIVNVRKCIIREIRSLLYIWERYGYSAAEKAFCSKRNDGVKLLPFIKGRLSFISYVKKNNSQCCKLRERLYSLLKKGIKKINSTISIYENGKWIDRLQEQEVYEDGLVKTITRHEIRDAVTTLISYNEYNRKRQLVSVKTYLYPHDRDLSCDFTTEYVYRGNNIIRERERDSSGNTDVTTLYEYKYNNDKLLIVEVHKKLGGSITSHNQYDCKKNLIKRKIYNSSELVKIIEYTYDDFGKIIKESTINYEKNYSGYVCLFYDKRGNCVTKELFKNNKPFKRIVRDIVYDFL